MAIDAAEVRRIAALAKLELPEDALPRMAEQLSGVLALAASLDELDLSGCEPAHLAPHDAEPRPDTPGERTLDAATATSGAAESEDGFFLVPPVVENLEP
jgi:aspartyl-tRNA(Asn)/glutamyl-tRNA(Gln) amidotransferase subunit C